MKRKLFGIVGALVVLPALGLVLTGCPTEADEDGGNSPKTATTLIAGQWTNGARIEKDKDGKGELDWYKFEAVSGKTYILHLDSSGEGSGTSTAMVVCSVYQSDEKTILCGIEEKFAYTNPRIISGYTGTVYVKVYGSWEYISGYNSGVTGTYAVKYEEGDSNDTKETASTLSNGNWADAQIWPRYDEDWYRFEASGGSYSLTWDDSGDGSGNSTCNISVSVFQSDGRTALNGVLDANSAYTTPKTFSGYTGTVYIRVYAGYTYISGMSDGTGTYAIKYTAQ
jgi:hypothetical protein